MEDQDFLDLSSRQEHLMREMNAYLKAIDITDSPGDNSAATMKVTNSQNKTLSSRLRVPPLATITSSSSSSSSSSSGSGDSMNKDSSTTNDDNIEVELKKRQGRRRSLINHLNSIDEHNKSNGSNKISADCYNHIYNEGQKVVYTNSEGSCLAVITKVHYDDELQPYYTIEIEGREKQTDNNHLSRFDNESEYEYFNEANTTTSSSQFEDDSLVAMAKRMDDSQTIISDPSLISCGTKEKAALLTLPNLPNITKKLGMSKGKQSPSSPKLDSPLSLDDDDDDDGNRSISSDSSSSASVEVFDYNGMTREQVMSMKRGRTSLNDAPNGNKEGSRSRGGTGKKNGEKTHSRRHHRSHAEEKRTSRQHSSSRSRRKRKDRKRRQHKHDSDDDESMHGIGFNTRVNKSDIDDRRRRTAQDERPIQQSHSRKQHHHSNQRDQNDSSDSDEHSSYDSDDFTQIFYESTDDEWCSAEEELVAVGKSVTDAVNNLNKKRGVKSLFGLR